MCHLFKRLHNSPAYKSCNHLYIVSDSGCLECFNTIINMENMFTHSLDAHFLLILRHTITGSRGINSFKLWVCIVKLSPETAVPYACVRSKVGVCGLSSRSADLALNLVGDEPCFLVSFAGALTLSGTAAARGSAWDCLSHSPVNQNLICCKSYLQT